MDKIKQNKNYGVVYKSFSFIVCIIILFSSLVVGSFASDEETVACIKLPKFTGNPTEDNYSECVQIIKNSTNEYGYYAYTESDADVYACFVRTSAGNVNYNVRFVSESECAVKYFEWYGYVSSPSTMNISGPANTSTNLNWGQIYGSFNSTSKVPQANLYDSGQDALDAVRDYIDNPPATSNPHELNYSLPAGNVLVIDVTNLNPTITLSMSTPTLEFQVTSTQYYGMISEIPNPVTLPISGTTPVNWIASGKKDPFGRSSSWVASETVSGITSDHGHAYFVIANPFSNNYTSANGSELTSSPNTTISINVSSCNYGKIYQLNESFNAGTFNNTQAGDTMSVNYNDDTGSWDTTNDTTGEADTPVYGGNNQGSTAINSVNEWLENISNKISSFFTGPINAVGTLVGAGSNFFRTLSGLYSWLPSPVLSVLTSALIVVITVGVIKVFI